MAHVSESWFPEPWFLCCSVVPGTHTISQFCGITDTDVMVLRCFGHWCLGFFIVTCIGALILQCYMPWCIDFAVSRASIHRFCSDKGTQCNILDKYDTRYRISDKYASSMGMHSGCEIKWLNLSTRQNDAKSAYSRGINQRFISDLIRTLIIFM